MCAVILQACFFREPYQCTVCDVAGLLLDACRYVCAHGHKEEQCHGYCCSPSSHLCSLVAIGWESIRRMTPHIFLQWLLFACLNMLCNGHAGAQQHEDAQAQANAAQQAASGEASGTHTKEPQSGFDDITVPDDSDHMHIARSDANRAGPSGAPDVRADSNRAGQGANQALGAVPVRAGPGAFPDGADQDDAEPAATLPGGTAKGGWKSGSNGQTAQAYNAKQKKLDWTAANGGHKRKAGSESKSPAKADMLPTQPVRTTPKRQCKLKLTPLRA